MRVSGEPTAPSMIRWPQLPLVPERVKRIGAFDVPPASRRPPLAIVRFTAGSNSIVVPGSIVSVTPLLTVTLPQTWMGLLVACQVAFALMTPLMQLGLFVA